MGSLTVDQLEGIHQTTEQEVQYLAESLKQLGGAQQRLHASRRCAKGLEEAEVGKDILVPLTSSVYVGGQLGDTSTVLIDLGTGYYVEVSSNDKFLPVHDSTVSFDLSFSLSLTSSVSSGVPP